MRRNLPPPCANLCSIPDPCNESAKKRRSWPQHFPGTATLRPSTACSLRALLRGAAEAVIPATLVGTIGLEKGILHREIWQPPMSLNSESFPAEKPEDAPKRFAALPGLWQRLIELWLSAVLLA